MRRPGSQTYLLKTMAHCVHCGALLWCEAHINKHAYYREQRGTRQDQSCPAAGRSVRCDTIDAQVGELFGSLVLPAARRSEIERRVADYERLRSVEQERTVLARIIHERL